MVVFRVENEEGEGMYGFHATCRPAPDDPLRRPMPRGEGMHCVGGRHFGFPTLQHLIEWIADESWVHRLVANGFRIAVYRSDDYIITKTQCCFMRHTATLLYHLKLRDLLPQIIEEQPINRDPWSD